MEKKEKTVTELRAEYAELREQLRAINDAVEADGRTELSEEENKRWDNISARAERVKRALKVAFMSDDPEVATEAKRAYADIPVEYRLTTERSRCGELFRELFRKGAPDGINLLLRESITAVGVAEAGGAIPVLIKDFIEPLEKGVIYGQLGIKVQTGLSADSKYPIASYVEAFVAGEKEVLKDSTISLGALTPKPRRIGLRIPLTGLANLQTNGALYSWILNTLGKSIARFLNRWCFQPSAIVSDMYGTFAYNSTSNAIVEQSLSAVPTYRELLDMRGKVMSSGAYADGTYCYVVSGLMYTLLESTPIAEGSDKMILVGGKIADIPVYITEEIESLGGGQYNATPKHVGFGRFSDLIMGQFGEMRLIVDPYSGAQADTTYMTVNSYWSMDVIRPGSFVIGTIA